MADLTINLLGQPLVRVAGRQLSWRSRKSLALLAYLATEGGVHHRQQLTLLLWPESSPAQGRTALRSALALLRRELADAAHFLLVERDTLALATEAVGLDVTLFQAALRQAATPQEVEQLAAALAAYRGDFLSGFAVDDAPEFEYWAAAQREALRRSCGALCTRLIAVQSEQGNLAAALATARRWVAISPLDEAAHRALMRMHLANADRVGALSAYEHCRRLLADELAIVPAPETLALAERIRTLALPALPLPVPSQPARQTAHTPALVGRGAEFETLVAAYASLQQAGPRIVLIEGEAGIGKSQLIRSWLPWASAQGADLLFGAAIETGGGVPYQPIVEALRTRVEQENAPTDLLMDVWLSELSRLLPELRERYPDLAPPIPDEATAQSRLQEAVARLLVALSQRAPLVLGVDDLQWADQPSCDLLAYLARRAADTRAPLLMVLAVRSDDLALSVELQGRIADLERSLPLRRLPLGPLDSAATRALAQALLAGPLPAPLETSLYTVTAGHPLYIVETLKHLTEQPAGPGINTAFTLDPGTPIPSSVQALIRTRLARLSSGARLLLNSAAVLGQLASFAQLRAVAGLDEAQALDALDELLARLLLREVDGYYQVSHDLVRSVAYAESSNARRQLAHQRAYAALRAAHAPPAVLSYHATSNMHSTMPYSLGTPNYGHAASTGVPTSSPSCCAGMMWCATAREHSSYLPI